MTTTQKIENLKAFATALVENFDQDVKNRSNFSKFSSFGWADISEAAEKLGFSELYNSDEFQALLYDYRKRCYILSETNDKLENGDRKHFILNWICHVKEPYEFTDEEWASDKNTFIALSEKALSFFKI